MDDDYERMTDGQILGFLEKRAGVPYGLVAALRKRLNHLRFTEDGFYHGRDSDDALGCRMCDGSAKSQMMLDIRGDW